jgi:hypothetical protein
MSLVEIAVLCVVLALLAIGVVVVAVLWPFFLRRRRSTAAD